MRLNVSVNLVFIFKFHSLANCQSHFVCLAVKKLSVMQMSDIVAHLMPLHMYASCIKQYMGGPIICARLRIDQLFFTLINEFHFCCLFFILNLFSKKTSYILLFIHKISFYCWHQFHSHFNFMIFSMSLSQTHTHAQSVFVVWVLIFY